LYCTSKREQFFLRDYSLQPGVGRQLDL